MPDVFYSLNVWKTSAGRDEKHFQDAEGAAFNNTGDDWFSDDVLFVRGSCCVFHNDSS